MKQKREYITQLDTKIISKCSLNDIDHEVDESTDVCTRIDKSLTKLRNYLDKYGTSVERTTAPQSPMIVVCPVPGVSTPPQQPSHLSSKYPMSQCSTSSVRNQGVRLPTIGLPRCNREITKFQHFWQSLLCC